MMKAKDRITSFSERSEYIFDFQKCSSTMFTSDFPVLFSLHRDSYLKLQIQLICQVYEDKGFMSSEKIVSSAPGSLAFQLKIERDLLHSDAAVPCEV